MIRALLLLALLFVACDTVPSVSEPNEPDNSPCNNDAGCKDAGEE